MIVRFSHYHRQPAVCHRKKLWLWARVWGDFGVLFGGLADMMRKLDGIKRDISFFADATGVANAVPLHPRNIRGRVVLGGRHILCATIIHVNQDNKQSRGQAQNRPGYF